MRISPVRISKLLPEVIKLSLKIITGIKLSLSENFELSEVEESVIISFPDFRENYGDNFSGNLSKSFDIFSLELSLKLPLKKVCYDVTNSNVALYKIR